MGKQWIPIPKLLFLWTRFTRYSLILTQKRTAIDGNNAVLESRLSKIETNVSKIKAVTDTVASLLSKVNTCEMKNERNETDNILCSAKYKSNESILYDVKTITKVS